MDAPFRHVEPVMGTIVSLDARDPVPPAALAAMVALLHHVDAVFSTYRPDSPVSRLARGELAAAEVPAEVAGVLALCAELTAETDGYFDAYAGGRLDPSGVVKGWAVHRAAQVLVDAGCGRLCLNGGGDIRAVGAPEPGRPWRVGIADPLAPGTLAAVLPVVDGAVATSGVAERGAHVLDPFTGLPAADLAGVTVVGPDLVRADAYATAAVAMGRRAPRWLADLPGYSSFVITRTGGRWRSELWPGVDP